MAWQRLGGRRYQHERGTIVEWDGEGDNGWTVVGVPSVYFPTLGHAKLWVERAIQSGRLSFPPE